MKFDLGVILQSLKVNYFQIKSNITDETIDLRAGTPIIEYRESIFSPYIELTAQLVDVGNTVKVEGSSDEGVGLLDAEIGEGTEEIIFEIQDNKGNKVSSIKEQKINNPRLQVNSAQEYAEIMNNLNLENPKMMDVAVSANIKGQTLDQL